MTCGVAQARRLGMKRVACVSTGNTSASMAAYASAGGLEPLIFIPHGNISYGKLAQALEYGAKTFQVEANFDQILALVRVLAERLGIYLLNSINPFRIEGQKSIVDRDDGSARLACAGLDRAARRQSRQHFGVRKGAARDARNSDFIDRLPRLAVVQAEGRVAVLRVHGSHAQANAEARFSADGASGDAGDGDQDRRSRVVA